MNLKLQTQELRKILQLYAQTITDDSVRMQIPSIYPTYEYLVALGSPVIAGTICSYGVNNFGEVQLYEFISNYTPIITYKPNEDITHYKKIGFDIEGYPIWTQPLGSTDAYQLNDIVSHNSIIWISTIINNIWEPGIYGWARHQLADEWPEFVQPTSAENVYNLGDKVTFNGQHYVSAINNNSWSPTAYPAGWTLQ